MRKWVLISAFLIIVLGCTNQDTQDNKTLYDRVPDVPGEVLYHDVIGNKIPADQVSVFGVKLGSLEQQIIDLHGQPDHILELSFGNIKNLEYSFNKSNRTIALYHLEKGVVTGILLTNAGSDLLHGNTTLNGTIKDLYFTLGLPTRNEDLHLQRRHIYNEYGYEFYSRKNNLDRVYFQQPNQDIKPAGEIKELDCEMQPTPAIRGDECIVFPRPCIVPDDWTIVSSCPKNNAPEICIQVITPAKNPSNGVCEEFPTPCDVPSDWEVVETCN